MTNLLGLVKRPQFTKLAGRALCSRNGWSLAVKKHKQFHDSLLGATRTIESQMTKEKNKKASPLISDSKGKKNEKF